MRAKVSVLIPAYNAEETIKRAIDSVPVRDDVEVIVWDDGSDDNTFEIAHTVLEERKEHRFGLTQRIREWLIR